MIKTIEAIVIMVNDLQKSVEFYTDVLGFSISNKIDMAEAGLSAPRAHGHRSSPRHGRAASHRTFQRGWLGNCFYEKFGENWTLGPETSSVVVLLPRLRAELMRLNPDLPSEAIETCHRRTHP
ncbi:MAG: VOC family protein [Candidatus Methanoperedens sp.]|nr:VOC family protein [Candidatus Methanoperedens sp.]MCE8427403.1 VOC family protein [Candidatus Methanoperedens sp.]